MRGPRGIDDLAGERILVVDDDESIRQIVSLFLTDEGFLVRAAVHGQAALDAIGEGYAPDVILLDLRMPVMDGWEFARLYREQPGPHAPIVAFVAALNAEQEQQTIDAVGVLAKPFDLEDLVTALSAALPSFSQANT